MALSAGFIYDHVLIHVTSLCPMGTFLRINGLNWKVNQGILMMSILGGWVGFVPVSYALAPDSALQAAPQSTTQSAPQSGVPQSDRSRATIYLAQASEAGAQTNFQQMLFVNPVLGSDETGDGTLRSPFRSITRAVQFAESDTVIMLAGGTYSQRTGERFPIGLPPGVRLLDMPNVTVTIQGEVLEGQAVAVAPAPVPDPVPASVPEGAEIEGRSAPVPQPRSLPAPEAVPAPVSFAPPVEIPVAPAPEPTAIEIPVLPPAVEVAPAIPRPAPAPSRLPTADAPIEIPVPPPENPMPLAVGRSAQPVTSRPTPPPQPILQAASPPQVNAVLPTPAPTANPNLLPVPDPNAPLGYVGDFPTVSLENFDVPSTPTTLPTAPMRTAARSPDPSLRYRVIVRLDNDALGGWIRSVVPEAFETIVNGEPVMQIGAFQTVENAEAAAEFLNQNGVRAIIQEL